MGANFFSAEVDDGLAGYFALTVEENQAIYDQ